MEISNGSQHFLPIEVLTRIFGYTDPHTLVTSCRSVCKLWKDVAESPAVWKIQIKLLAIRNEAIDSILPTAHRVYPWYICYGICKNIFGVNMFSTNTHEVCAAGRPRCWATDEDHNYARETNTTQNGSSSTAFSPPPQDLLDEEVNLCLLAAIDECCVDHTIDLYECGFTKKILELQPPIFISEWYAVRQNAIGLYHLDVTLVNPESETDYENGQFSYEGRTERMIWNKVTHTFTNYRPDVRYIVFHHGVKIIFPTVPRIYRGDGQQNPYSKMAGAKIVIMLPNT